jgi:hypothetical protein
MKYNSEPASQLHLHPSPELRAESRSTEGQRLDAVRDEFRVEWQAKIQESRHQQERARHHELWWENFRVWILRRGVGYGAFFAGIGGLFINRLPGGLLGVLGGVLAFATLIILSLICEAWFQSRAERLERELRELERS